jgi:RimJ/RimL family protein N-acetyltransferase
MLRPWSIEDGPALARLTQDPGFVEFSTFSPLSGDEAREFLASRLEIMQTGFGIWAVVENQRELSAVQPRSRKCLPIGSLHLFGGDE